ncbi:hypothetical protein RDABS01_000792 [Bienertia sinuspersici]
MAAHIQNYTQYEGNSFLLYRQFTNSPENHEHYTLFHDSAQKESIPETFYTFTCPFMPSGSYFRVVGSVNGLICLSDDLFGYTYLVLLWNPLLHKYIRLPLPRVIRPVKGAHISAFGFGYDSRKGSHKVVRVSYMRNNQGLDITPPLVELYSVQEGRWRWVVADSVVDICICDYWWSQCFLNRAIHWVAWERDAGTRVFSRNSLLLFDVEEEKFKKMKLPEALAKELTLNLCVSEYGGKLSVLHSVRKGTVIGNEMDRCEIWVKGEYNVGSSWCKMFGVEMNSSAGLGWIQCLRKNGDVLAFTKNGELVSYDPLKKQTNRLHLHGCWRSWFTCSYSESLILLDKKKGISTYDAAAGKRKKFGLLVLSNGVLDMEEKEADSKDVEQQQQSDGVAKSIYHQGKALLLEQLVKFDGGRMTKEPQSFCLWLV